MDQDFKKYLLKQTKSSDCRELEIIQSLWSGYGKISRYRMEDSFLETVVIKNITLSNRQEHPRGWDSKLSHIRKVKSYQVESQWYKKFSQECSLSCRIPKYYGTYTKGEQQWIILEDLNHEFPIRKQDLHLDEVKVCLKWLANFHATFLNRKPVGLWQIGTYWHLDTRPDEFDKIEDINLKANAHLIDKALNDCVYKTFVHGDAKLANFCFSKKGLSVAAVDFQYVGGGCGMKNVAYFLSSCLSGEESKRYEKELLDTYFQELNKKIAAYKTDIDFQSLEEEWRRMYPIACSDFSRFLLGWMPTHHKLNAYQLNILESVLSRLN